MYSIFDLHCVKTTDSPFCQTIKICNAQGWVSKMEITKQPSSLNHFCECWIDCVLFCSGYKNRQIKRRTNYSLKGSFVSLLKICRHRESKINPFSSMQIEHLKQFSSGIADICDRIRRIHTNFRLLKSCTTFNIKSFFVFPPDTKYPWFLSKMQEAPLIPNCNGDIYSRGMSYGLRLIWICLEGREI